MKRVIVGLGLILGACAPPTTAPGPINISNTNTNNNGTTNGAQETCKVADTVNISVPTQIAHGVPTPVSLIPTLAGQVLSNACGPINWVAQSPCVVGNAGAQTTFLTGDVSGQSCAVQGCYGDVCSPEVTVRVN